MRGLLTFDELSGLIDQGRVDTVVTAFVDMQGRLMGKRVAAEFFREHVAEHGLHFCNYLLGTDMEMTCPPGFRLMSWEQGYGDWLGVPDLATLRPLPWVDGTALVLCDVVGEDGAPVPVSPRCVLRRQVEAAAAQGLRPRMASELEFYLLRETYDSVREKRFHDLCTFGSYNEDYHILQGAKCEPVVRRMRNALTAAGVPVEFSKGEAGPGQHEINLRYADAVDSADRHVLFKQGAKEIAMAEGIAVTFMAKLHPGYSGSSSHIHLSLWDPEGTVNRFAAVEEAAVAGSRLMRGFLGGLTRHLPDFALLLAPTVNSYKRYAPGSWAPVNFAWGRDNRTCGLRVVGEGASLRIETRIPGADCNPYLAYAAVLAAGLRGVREGLQPPPEFRGNAYKAEGLPRMPADLRESARRFRGSAAVREALGEAVAEHYAHAAMVEQAEFDRAVTCWERERYLERI